MEKSETNGNATRDEIAASNGIGDVFLEVHRLEVCYRFHLS